ncbi:MAG: prepilin-type N-terminal cleavage/methylation domain-containing protein [Verrucomicrobia bacterium]|nr:prepilin-type N-terminal cleavage/methylation domain-containing protein [Verrucomicrobiota bacterium]
MDFHRTRYRGAAFTLPELLVGMAIAALCGTALAGFLFQFSRNSTAIVSFTSVNSTDRHSLQRVARDFREADSFFYLSPSNISLNVNGDDVELIHDPLGKSLVRKTRTDSDTLLRNCETLSFSFLERNPTASSFESFLVSTSSTCRILEISWVSLVREDKKSRWTVTNSARFLNRRGLSD